MVQLRLAYGILSITFLLSSRFVEIMAPVFSREAWRCVWHMIQVVVSLIIMGTLIGLHGKQKLRGRWILNYKEKEKIWLIKVGFDQTLLIWKICNF